MFLTDTLDGVLIEAEEDGFHLIASGEEGEWRFRLPSSIALELMRAVDREIRPWWQEAESARAQGPVIVGDSWDESFTGYELDDPKHPTYHERMSELWDTREGK